MFTYYKIFFLILIIFLEMFGVPRMEGGLSFRNFQLVGSLEEGFGYPVGSFPAGA